MHPIGQYGQQLRPVLIVLEFAPLTPKNIKTTKPPGKFKCYATSLDPPPPFAGKWESPRWRQGLKEKCFAVNQCCGSKYNVFIRTRILNFLPNLDPDVMKGMLSPNSFRSNNMFFENWHEASFYKRVQTQKYKF